MAVWWVYYWVDQKALRKAELWVWYLVGRTVSMKVVWRDYYWADEKVLMMAELWDCCSVEPTELWLVDWMAARKV